MPGALANKKRTQLSVTWSLPIARGHLPIVGRGIEELSCGVRKAYGGTEYGFGRVELKGRRPRTGRLAVSSPKRLGPTNTLHPGINIAVQFKNRIGCREAGFQAQRSWCRAKFHRVWERSGCSIVAGAPSFFRLRNPMPQTVSSTSFSAVGFNRLLDGEELVVESDGLFDE